MLDSLEAESATSDEKRYIWRSILNVEIKIVDLLPLLDDDWDRFQADSTMITYFCLIL